LALAYVQPVHRHRGRALGASAAALLAAAPLHALESDSAQAATCLHAGKSVAIHLKQQGKRVLLTLKKLLKIAAEEKLEITLA